MPATVSSLNPCITFRRICSWCHSDLGPLQHPAEQHSYGICASCQNRYFAYLYQPDIHTNEANNRLRARAAGG